MLKIPLIPAGGALDGRGKRPGLLTTVHTGIFMGSLIMRQNKEHTRNWKRNGWRESINMELLLLV